MTLVFRAAARSDVGSVRTRNEDSGYASEFLLVVADGMGGHAAGELASATAVATLAQLPVGLSHDSSLDWLAEASRHVDLAGQRITDAIRSDQDRSGMGTTMTAGLLWDDALTLIHIGDSRAYLWRDGVLNQLTHDHTYVQSLVDSGQLAADQAESHPRRNLLLRVLDGTPDMHADIGVHAVHSGDRLLLCSDGLSSYVSESVLHAGLSHSDATAAVTYLVEQALSAGGLDNITVIVADVIDAVDVPSTHEDQAVVVGAAAEPRNRHELPGIEFPADAIPDPDAPTSRGPRERLVAALAPTPTRRAVWRWSIALVVALSMLGTLFGAIWTSRQWYIAADDAGMVVIHRGIPASIVGIPLSTPVESTEIHLTNLPAYDQALLADAIHAQSLAQAREVIVRLACRATPVVSPCPTATP